MPQESSLLQGLGPGSPQRTRITSGIGVTSGIKFISRIEPGITSGTGVTPVTSGQRQRGLLPWAATGQGADPAGNFQDKGQKGAALGPIFFLVVRHKHPWLEAGVGSVTQPGAFLVLWVQGTAVSDGSSKIHCWKQQVHHHTLTDIGFRRY